MQPIFIISYVLQAGITEKTKKVIELSSLINSGFYTGENIQFSDKISAIKYDQLKAAINF